MRALAGKGEESLERAVVPVEKGTVRRGELVVFQRRGSTGTLQHDSSRGRAQPQWGWQVQGC